MRLQIALPAFFLSAALFGCTTTQPAHAPTRPNQTPASAPSSPPPLSDAQIHHIHELIHSLAACDKPDFGLSATIRGADFAPIAGQQNVQTLLMANHGLEQSESLKDLVAIGPDALPFLLDALDNNTPTKLVISHDGGMGAMWFGQEIQVNPVNPAEAGIVNTPINLDDEERIDSYTVKVGDICFVAIGQIVGRPYQAVRYQPTACIVLNSPTHNAALCAHIRSIWKSNNPRQKLFDSLHADFAVDSDYQCQAALRMAYYFPKETVPMLAARLEKLDVENDASYEAATRRSTENGLQANDLIKALAWSPQPAIRQAIIHLFKQAGDVDCLLATLPAIQDKDLIRQRLEAVLIALPESENDKSYCDANCLLSALIQYTPDTAKAIFERYLQPATLGRCNNVSDALAGQKVSWDVDLLLPMLADKRTFSWIFDDPEHKTLARNCDQAAVTLSQNHPSLKFIPSNDYADMDRQIAAIKTALTAKPAQ